MPVRIRLARRGRKKLAIYDIVVADSRSPRDGRFIEKLGSYNPNAKPATVEFRNEEKVLYWLGVGAQPSDTARALLSGKGLMLKMHLKSGVDRGHISEEVAEERYQAWVNERDQATQARADAAKAAASQSKQSRLDAERQKKEARQRAITERREAEKMALLASQQPAAEAAESGDAPATEAEATPAE